MPPRVFLIILLLLGASSAPVLSFQVRPPTLFAPKQQQYDITSRILYRSSYVSPLYMSQNSRPPSIGALHNKRRRQQQQQQKRHNKRSCSSSKSSARHGDDLPYSTTNGSTSSKSVEDLLVSDPKKLNTNIFVWFLPIINMISAFVFYTRTQLAFHTFMDEASGHLWINVDGNLYMNEIVKPVLNGPVTLSISILFGTLISMTIQTLYRRQIMLHQTLISTVEEVRELQWLVEGFPEPYRGQAHGLLGNFLHKSFQDFQPSEGTVTPESLRTVEMTQMLVLLNNLSKDDKSPDIIVCEAYGCVHRLKDRRAEFMSGLQTVFSTAHYVVISLLACTLLFVFLLESDNDTLQFLLDFQLSICWSLLIGSYSMLAVIIYDLSRPFTGIFTTMKGVDFVASERATEVVPDSILLTIDDDDESEDSNDNSIDHGNVIIKKKNGKKDVREPVLSIEATMLSNGNNSNGVEERDDNYDGAEI